MGFTGTISEFVERLVPRRVRLRKKNLTGREEPATWDDFLASPKRSLYAGRITREKQFQGYFGITPFIREKNHIIHDVSDPMPIPDKSVEVYQSEDVFEHIPLENVVTVFNEIARVLKPGGLFRLSVPDYRFDVYDRRSVKNGDGSFLFDPGGGGRLLDGKVVDGGHLWFPRYELVKSLLEESDFKKSDIEFLHYYNEEGKSVTNKVDYSKGYILRTPDHDERGRNPYRAISLVVDVRK